MERYFLIAYTGVTGTDTLHHGCLYISANKFPSLTEILTGAKKITPFAENIVISSFYEFKSKSDWQSFNA